MKSIDRTLTQIEEAEMKRKLREKEIKRAFALGEVEARKPRKGFKLRASGMEERERMATTMRVKLGCIPRNGAMQ